MWPEVGSQAVDRGRTGSLGQADQPVAARMQQRTSFAARAVVVRDPSVMCDAGLTRDAGAILGNVVEDVQRLAADRTAAALRLQKPTAFLRRSGIRGHRRVGIREVGVAEDASGRDRLRAALADAAGAAREPAVCFVERDPLAMLWRLTLRPSGTAADPHEWL